MAANATDTSAAVRRLAELLGAGLISVQEFDAQRQSLFKRQQQSSAATAAAAGVDKPRTSFANFRGPTSIGAPLGAAKPRPPVRSAWTNKPGASAPSFGMPPSVAAAAARLAPRPPVSTNNSSPARFPYRSPLAAIAAAGRFALQNQPGFAGRRSVASPPTVPSPAAGRFGPQSQFGTTPVPGRFVLQSQLPSANTAGRFGYRPPAMAAPSTASRGRLSTGPMRSISTVPAPSNRFQPYTPPLKKSRTLVVRPIPFSATEETLKTAFGQYGEISNAVVHRTDPESLGLGIVTFADSEMTQQVIDMQYIEIEGVICFIERDNRGTMKPAGPSTKLLISNLPPAVSVTELTQLLSQQPGFKALLPPVSPDAGVPGYAYVHFGSVADATKAKTDLSGLVVQGYLVEPRFDFGQAP